jgi:AbrB family looped-hinge helix DNA binding protein
MLVELRGRAQLTIPAEIVKEVGISEGDKFDIVARDGGIFLCPVVVYPKDKLTKIAKIIKKINVSKDYDDVDAMFADMGINLDES